MQRDGNLVLYAGPRALWQTGTRGRGLSLTMQPRGELSISGGAGIVWHIGEGRRPGSHLQLQDDGNLVLYDGRGRAWWETETDRGNDCPANTAESLRRASGRQILTVTAVSSRSTRASLRRWQKLGRCWRAVGGTFPARLGYAGLRLRRQEGDGSTPVGNFRLGPVLYGIDGPSPNRRYAFHHLVCGDWWDEDPSSTHYNSFEHIGCGAHPSWTAQSEALWTEAPAYDYMAVIEYNTPPRGAVGSGIFLHEDVGGPTNGCVSLSASALRTALGWLDPMAHPHIVIATAAEIAQY